MANDTLDEHRAMLEVYEARIARAKIVAKRYEQERKKLQDELDWVQKRIASLEKEVKEAPQVVEDYTAKLAAARKLVAELESGRGVMPCSTGTKKRKPPNKVEQARRLAAKLQKALKDEPSLLSIFQGVARGRDMTEEEQKFLEQYK